MKLGLFCLKALEYPCARFLCQTSVLRLVRLGGLAAFLVASCVQSVPNPSSARIEASPGVEAILTRFSTLASLERGEEEIARARPIGLKRREDGKAYLELAGTDPAVDLTSIRAYTIDSSRGEVELFLVPLPQGDFSITDSDGDGAVNAVELWAGSDPLSEVDRPTEQKLSEARAIFPGLVVEIPMGQASTDAGDVEGGGAPAPTEVNTVITGRPSTPTNSRSAVLRFAAVPPDPSATYTCRLNDGPEEACVSPHSMEGLEEGSHRFEVRARTSLGDDPTPSAHSWVVDLTPPATVLEGKVPAVVKEDRVQIPVGSSEAGSSFACRVDGGPEIPYAKSGSLVIGSEGDHVLRCFAKDVAGNRDPSGVEIRVRRDATGPVISFILKPPPVTAESELRVSVKGEDPGGIAWIRCSMDDGDPVPCGGREPAVFKDVKEGTHKMRVEGADSLGNVSDPIIVDVTVDLTPPTTSITAAPSTPTTRRTEVFRFEGKEEGITFECRVDDAEFRACSSPHEVKDLEDGRHVFEVRARDAAGNVDPKGAAHTWVLDGSPPETRFTEELPGMTGGSATFVFASNELQGKFECSLDGAAYKECRAPVVLSNLASGAHAFKVRAIDGVGLIDTTPATHAWTVDATPPETMAKTGPAAFTSEESVQVEFSAVDETGKLDGVRFECKLDGGPFSSCTSPHVRSGLSTGEHRFEARAIDALGNVDATPAAWVWTVDRTAPVLTFIEEPAGPRKDRKLRYRVSASEVLENIECLFDGSPLAVATCALEVSIDNAADGAHTFQIKGPDRAGWVGETKISTVVVDNAPPVLEMKPGTPSAVKAANPSFEFIAQDALSGMQETRCGLDSSAILQACSGGRYDVVYAADGPHTLRVVATDKAGNSTEKIHSFLVDTRPPQAAFVLTPPALFGSRTVRVQGSATDENGISEILCQVTGKNPIPCGASPAEFTLSADGQYTATVTAKDALGNESAGITHVFNVDTAPPVLSFRSPLVTTPTRATSFSFYLGSDEPLSTLVCSVSSGSVACDRTSMTALVTAAGEGVYNFFFEGTDALGHKATSISKSIVVDRTGPQLVLPASKVTKEATFVFEVDAYDALSGLSKVDCKLGSGFPKDCTAQAVTFDVPTEGDYLIQVDAVDQAGNHSSQSYFFAVDRTVPSVSLQAPAPTDWVRGPVTLSFNVSDDRGAATLLACVKNVSDACTVDTCSPIAGSGPGTGEVDVACTPGSTCRSCVVYAARDEAGNISAKGTAWLKLDAAAPQITTGSQALVADGQRGFTASVEIGDSGAGVASCHLELGLQPEIVQGTIGTGGTCSAAYVCSVPGSQAASVIAEDGAGNQAAKVLTTGFECDKTPPASSVDLGSVTLPSGAAQIVDGGPRETYGPYTLRASDGSAGTGIKRIAYRINTGAENACQNQESCPVEIPWNCPATDATCSGTLYYFAEDKLGNMEIVKSVPFTLDRKPPYIMTLKDGAIVGWDAGMVSLDAPSSSQARICANWKILETYPMRVEDDRGAFDIALKEQSAGAPACGGDPAWLPVNKDGTPVLGTTASGCVDLPPTTPAEKTYCIHLKVSDRFGNLACKSTCDTTAGGVYLFSNAGSLGGASVQDVTAVGRIVYAGTLGSVKAGDGSQAGAGWITSLEYAQQQDVRVTRVPGVTDPSESGAGTVSAVTRNSSGLIESRELTGAIRSVPSDAAAIQAVGSGTALLSRSGGGAGVVFLSPGESQSYEDTIAPGAGVPFLTGAMRGVVAADSFSDVSHRSWTIVGPADAQIESLRVRTVTHTALGHETGSFSLSPLALSTTDIFKPVAAGVVTLETADTALVVVRGQRMVGSTIEYKLFYAILSGSGGAAETKVLTDSGSGAGDGTSVLVRLRPASCSGVPRVVIADGDQVVLASITQTPGTGAMALSLAARKPLQGWILKDLEVDSECQVYGVVSAGSGAQILVTLSERIDL